MRFWLFNGAPPRRGESHTDPTTGHVFNFTPGYTELFSPGRYHITGASMDAGAYRDTYIVVYWIQLSQTEWVVATCWGDYFDFFHHLMNYPETSAGTRRAIAESCPLFNTLIQRASNPTNYGTSLFTMADPDTNETVWLLGAFFGNLHVNTTGDLFDGFAGEKFTEVIDLTGMLVPEVGGGPLEVPKLLEYIGSESNKEFFRGMVRSAPETLRKITDFARIFTG
ncbi:hypothetical protein ACIO7M_31685 [Streptomyces toxytricini]|uniref:Uncharacterized protein n=1 Tax=Streptomyces toxytricini TaxID=67369 RepID=A0ABW8ETN2_STRT5